MSPLEDALLLFAIVRRHLQVYAVEARYEEGPFPLPADRAELLASIQQLIADSERNAQS